MMYQAVSVSGCPHMDNGFNDTQEGRRVNIS